MSNPEEVCLMSEFCEATSIFVDQVRETHRPLAITKNGKPSAVLMSAEAYQDLLDNIQTLSDIAESEAEIANGGGVEQGVFYKQLQAKYFRR